MTLFLSARYRRPGPVALGVAVGCVLNHGLAIWIGRELGGWLTADTAGILAGLTFVVMGVWALLGDNGDGDHAQPFTDRGFGPFLTAALVFFALETGDKTQFAAAGLALRYEQAWLVLAASVTGLLIANLPALWLGHRHLHRIPRAWLRRLSAGLFLLVGGVLLAGPLWPA